LFLLNVPPVVPYPLSVNVDVTVRSRTGSSAVGVTRQLDINADGRVNILDLAIAAPAFGSTPLSTNWNPRADFDANGMVNIVDLATLAFYFDTPDFI
jgi:hypothetical protein